MPLSSDPGKARQWQQRSQQKAIARMREKGQKIAPRERDGKPPERRPRSRTRHNDGPWRRECIEAYGERCKACGTTSDIQMDHMHPKSQGGKSDVENGLPLCETHHRMKTDSELRIDPAWLTPAQLDYLAEKNWVSFDDDGQPSGRGYKHFEPRTVRDR